MLLKLRSKITIVSLLSTLGPWPTTRKLNDEMMMVKVWGKLGPLEQKYI